MKSRVSCSQSEKKTTCLSRRHLVWTLSVKLQNTANIIPRDQVKFHKLCILDNKDFKRLGQVLLVIMPSLSLRWDYETCTVYYTRAGQIHAEENEKWPGLTKNNKKLACKMMYNLSLKLDKALTTMYEFVVLCRLGYKQNCPRSFKPDCCTQLVSVGTVPNGYKILKICTHLLYLFIFCIE